MEKILSNKSFKIIVAILIILILIVVYTKSSQKSVTLIANKSDFNELIKKDDTIIIDVRTESEYNEGHIPKAINIPYNELETKIKFDKDKEIVVYSQNDSRSHLATVVLENMGYTNIYEGDISKYDGKLVTD